MLVGYLRKIGWFVGLVLLQVLILNRVDLGGYATPFLYVYLLLKFESDISRNSLMLIAFFIGLMVDVFSDTPGMNAAASVLLAFGRPLLLNLFKPRDSVEGFVPGIDSMGTISFLKYAVAGVAIHHALLLSLEYFSMAYIGEWLLQMVASTLLTVLCVMALEYICKR